MKKNSIDFLLSLQCLDRMEDQIELLNFLEKQLDNSENDCLIRICEKVSFICFQDSNFGISKINSEVIQKILRRIKQLCKIWIDNGFVDCSGFEWFCGRDLNISEPNYSKERVICASILSNSLLEEESGFIISYLEKCSLYYQNSWEYCHKLINNDERCLMTITALLPYIREIPSTSTFFPPTLFYNILEQIDYDCEVILDWLNSELVACSFLLRVLKSNWNPETRELWKKYQWSMGKLRKTEKMLKWRETEKSEKVLVELKIKEPISDGMVSHKTFRFSGMEKKRVLLNCHGKDDTWQRRNFDNCFEKWMATASALKSKIRRLIKANLIGERFETIAKWCEKCEKNCIE